MLEEVKKEIDNAQKLCEVVIRFKECVRGKLIMKVVDYSMLINALQYPSLNKWFKWEVDDTEYRLNIDKCCAKNECCFIIMNKK